MNRNLFGRFDTEAYLIAPYLDHGDVILSLMMMLSFFLRERTSIAAPLWCSSRPAQYHPLTRAENDAEVGRNVTLT